MGARTVEVNGGRRYGGYVYKVDPWDEANNPYLMEWVALHEDPEKALARLAESHPFMTKLIDDSIRIGAMTKNGPAETRRLVMDLVSGTMGRKMFIVEYGFALPDRAALALVAKHAPRGVLEIGAGTGYWAAMLSKLGVDVIATDSWTGLYGTEGIDERYPSGLAHAKHFDVLRESHKEPLADPERHQRTLFMCWPDREEPWPAEALSLYKGDTVVHVGEWQGATGDARFYRILGRDWEEAARCRIPQWDGIHDFLSIHNRKEATR